MNRSWDIMRNAANGADPDGSTPRMDETRPRDREHFTSSDREEAPYGYGGYGHAHARPLAGPRDPEGEPWIEHGAEYGYGFDYGDRIREMEGMQRQWRARAEDDASRAQSGPPSLWRRLKGAFAGKGPRNWTRPDARIFDDVCEALTDDPRLDASDVEVSVEDGEVTLTGTVDGRRSKRLADAIADRVRGVKDVHNRLRLRPDEGAMEGAVEGAARGAGAEPPAAGGGSRGRNQAVR